MIGGIGFQPVRVEKKKKRRRMTGGMPIPHCQSIREKNDRQDAYPTCQCVHGLTTNNANGTNTITVDPAFV
jgi:hypothetical protein